MSRQAKHPEIGRRIGEFLEGKGVKAAFVAEQLAKTQQAVSAAINGINDATLDLLLWATTQGCDANWMLTGERKEPETPFLAYRNIADVANDERLALVVSVWTRLTRHEKAAIAALAEGAAKRPYSRDDHVRSGHDYFEMVEETLKALRERDKPTPV